MNLPRQKTRIRYRLARGITACSKRDTYKLITDATFIGTLGRSPLIWGRPPSKRGKLAAEMAVYDSVDIIP
jgi:hypothetical protein